MRFHDHHDHPHTEELHKKESLAHFLFVPRYGKKVRDIGANIRGFVRLIGMIFAMNGLFPKNHPALQEVPGAKLTIGEIIATAYRNLDFTKQGIPQVVLFVGVVGTLLFSALTAVTGLMLLLMGTAHAGTTVTGCTNTGLFSPCGDGDLAIQWLDYLFASKTLADANGLPVPQSTVIQTALRAALSLFSNAVLILAGIILMYHLLSMVVETAHSGKPMGGANQIWAPIRLVIAIGLLIPVASSGLNVGQSIAIQMAKWGSGLASQTWSKFLVALASESDKTLIMPDTPPAYLQATIQDIVAMRACEYLYNYTVVKNAEMYGSNSGTYIITELGSPPEGGSGGQLQNSNDGAICGTWRYTKAFQTSDPYTSGIYNYYNDTFSPTLFTNAGVGAQIREAARKIAFYYSAPEEGSNISTITDTTIYGIWQAEAGLSSPTVEEIKPDDIKEIANTAWTTIQAGISGIQGGDTMKTALDTVIQKWSGDGWVSAGAWFNTIARMQGYIMDANRDALVKTVPPDLRHMAQTSEATAANHYKTAKWKDYAYNFFKNAMPAVSLYALFKGDGDTTFRDKALKASPPSIIEEVAGQLSQFQSSMSEGHWGNHSDSTVAAAGTGSESNARGGDNIALFLQMVENLGESQGLWPKNGALMFQLNSSNPLAELAKLGHAFLENGLNLVALGTGASVGGALVGLMGPYGALLGNMVGAVGSLGVTVGCMLVAVGLTLSFILPMVPFVYFFFGVLEWLMVVFESVVCAPIFALAHLNPDGPGMPGQMARKGYEFLLSILLRPVMCVFGLIAGLLLFFICIAFLNRLFIVAAYGTGSYSGFATISKLIFSLMYAFIAYLCADTCFKSIDYFPDVVMNWMSGSAARTNDLGSPAALEGKMAPVMAALGSRGLGQMSSGVTSATAGLGKGAAGVIGPMFADMKEGHQASAIDSHANAALGDYSQNNPDKIAAITGNDMGNPQLTAAASSAPSSFSEKDSRAKIEANHMIDEKMRTDSNFRKTMEKGTTREKAERRSKMADAIVGKMQGQYK